MNEKTGMRPSLVKIAGWDILADIHAKPEIKQIPYWEVESVWPEVSPMIQKAIDVQDEVTLEGVFNRLRYPQNNHQLWRVGKTGAIVTILQNYETGVRKCLLFLGGGTDLKNSLPTHEEIEVWAKKYFGCHKTIMHGRRGWKKVLPGYEEVTVCLEKKL